MLLMVAVCVLVLFVFSIWFLDAEKVTPMEVRDYIMRDQAYKVDQINRNIIRDIGNNQTGMYESTTSDYPNCHKNNSDLPK
jgi:hypothetical protein